MKKPNTGYKKKAKVAKTKKEKKYIHKLLVASKANVSLQEKVIKFIIYIALRLVIRPSKWRHPQKNYEVIDRTYKKIMSADFIFIPSSIAFYIIMAFIPVLAIIIVITNIPAIHSLVVTSTGDNAIKNILSKFIPGMDQFFTQLNDIAGTTSDWTVQKIGGYIAIGFSLALSTWIAAGGFAKIVYTQSHIFEHKFVGGYWMNKLKGMFMVLAFAIYLVICLIINIAIEQWLINSNLNTEARRVISYIVLVINLFVLVFIGIVIMFKFSPRFLIKLKHVIPGAMVTTLPITSFLVLFGSITSIWSYGSYGALGVVMYIGMSALLVSNFIFVGMIVNAAYYRTFVRNKPVKKWTFSRK